MAMFPFIFFFIFSAVTISVLKTILNATFVEYPDLERIFLDVSSWSLSYCSAWSSTSSTQIPAMALVRVPQSICIIFRFVKLSEACFFKILVIILRITTREILWSSSLLLISTALAFLFFSLSVQLAPHLPGENLISYTCSGWPDVIHQGKALVAHSSDQQKLFWD